MEKFGKLNPKKLKYHMHLKEMSKLKVIDKKSIKSINSERELLSKLHHPFIVNMHYAFQDNENLYLIMDLLSGGDLRFHISRHKKFSEEQTRFFICGIIFSLEYIHSHNIIHRDIKPENLVLDENGYIRLTDFGIAKENLSDNSSETSGTPGYMSPEVMKSLNHSFPADYFALGVIGYEFMKGERPYCGRNRKEIKEQIMSRQAEIKIEDINESWSKESADFINKLLIRKPEQRLGFRGINELKEHPWLKYYPWLLIKDKTLPSPFVPENRDNFDKRYCENIEHIGEETKTRYEEILLDNNYGNYFKNFYYNEEEDKRRNINNNKSKNKDNNNDNHKGYINNKGLIKRGKNNRQIEKNKEINNDIYNICKINSLINKIDKPNKKIDNNNLKGINVNIKKILKARHIKSGSVCSSKTANMICINFNINNHTNNNIIGNGNNINSFYFNSNSLIPNHNMNNKNNNIQSERIKKIIHKKPNNIYHSETTNNNSIYFGLQGLTLGQINSPLNRAIRGLIKNNKNNSKIKKGKKQSKTKYNHNNSLVKNLSKAYLSQMKTQKNKIRNKNYKLEIMNLTNKNNSITTNTNRRTFSHSFSNKDIKFKNIQKKISNDNIRKDLNNKQTMHENANTISVNDDINYRVSFKRLNKISMGRISHRLQKNKYNLKNESIETLERLSNEKKNSKAKIKSLKKYSDKNIKKNKNNNNNVIDKNKEKNLNIGNIIYSKRCMLERKKIQFASPIPNCNSGHKSNKNQCSFEKKQKKQNENNQIVERIGSQFNIFQRNNNNQLVFSERIKIKNEEISLNKEERRNINNNSFLSRKSIHKIIPSGINKKIKVNKIVNLNG